MRTIQICAEPCDLDTFRDVVGIEALQEAIGYFSAWGFDDDTVFITIDQKRVEMLARYDTGCTATYVIGAVYSKADNKFSFHS